MQVRCGGGTLLLLDVAVTASLQRDFLRNLVDSSPRALATVPAGDVATRRALETLGARPGPAARDVGRVAQWQNCTRGLCVRLKPLPPGPLGSRYQNWK